MYNWALARSLGGTFVLRIEDTDRARSTDESLKIIFGGLAWLGIDWDEGPDFEVAGKQCGGGDYGPYFQMERLDRYEVVAEQLLAAGHAYRCFCTPERMDEVRAKQKANKSAFLGYDGHCRNLTDADRAALDAKGVSSNLRFRMPRDRVVKVTDLIRGEVEVNTKQLDDWVMVRPDGVPLYNFACVVDDLDMKITHVVRGEEHFLNGIKQTVLFEALGHESPQFAHIPLIFNQKGAKLSKRDPGVKSTLEYRDLGYPPEAVFNYIALLGWGFSADRDVFTKEEMVAAFKISSVGKAPAKFDSDKLHWMCGEYIRKWSVDECLPRSRQWLEAALPRGSWDSHQGFLRNVVACYQERVVVLSEFPDKAQWLFADPELDEQAAKAIKKRPECKAWFTGFADVLEALPMASSFPAARGDADEAVRLPTAEDADEPASTFATPAALERAARAYTEANDIKFGHFVGPVRAALTGTNKGPGFFDVVFLLGKEACLRRLRKLAHT
tara:strand:- start:2134 stop:3627 length:1494 start_codon:yes stop_codon:yes gene_type:complete